jgi:uncharacterized protein (TIGR02145 family)
MNMISSKFALLLLTLALAGCSVLDDGDAENSAIIHYYIDLEEAGLITADSAVVDVWQEGNATPAHQLFTDMENVIATINAPKNANVTLFVRVYRSGRAVGAMRHDFVAGERANAKKILALDFATERDARLQDTVAFLAGYTSFGFVNASCTVDGVSDVGGCALRFNAPGDHAYPVVFSDGLHFLTENVRVHVIAKTPVLGVIVPSDRTAVPAQSIVLAAPSITDEDNDQIDSLWWDLNGDGTYETKAQGGIAQTVSFATVGSYTVGAYAWDVWGVKDTTTLIVQVNPGFWDSRDGQWYQIVTIGTQTWMAENLNVGVMVPTAVDQSDDGVIEKYCYEDNAAYCTTDGALYQWAEAMGFKSACNSVFVSDAKCNAAVSNGHHQGICPTGWHMPKPAEWDLLAAYLGGDAVAGKTMKFSGTGYTDWDASTFNDGNTSGFSALPVGHRSFGGSFFNRGLGADFWVAWEYGASNAYIRTLNNGFADLNDRGSEETYGYSVRCLRDE